MCDVGPQEQRTEAEVGFGVLSFGDGRSLTVYGEVDS